MSIFDNESITIARKAAAPTYVDGHPVQASASTPVAATASIQPAPTKKLEILPEGDRSRDPQMVYTKTELRLNDVVTRSDGSKYEVVEVADWSHALRLAHWEVLALKVNPA